MSIKIYFYTWFYRMCILWLPKQELERMMGERGGIHSTLYLGVGKDEGKMIAHAWLRCGQMYVTGGNGSSYAMVAKFRN